MKVLILSDAHVPDRVPSIPKKVKEMIEREKPYDLVIYAGDLTGDEVLSWIDTLGPIVVVRGNMDYLPLPEERVVEVGDFKVLVIHGHQVWPRGNLDMLNEIARERGADVIVHGHTHYPIITQKDGIIHLNPGSVTGAWGGGGGSMTPSFIVAEIDNSIRGVLYEVKGKVRVTPFEFRKA